MKNYIFILALFTTFFVQAQDKILTPHFSIDEYIVTLKMNFCQYGSIHDSMLCKPEEWQRIYRSPVVGMDNRFDIWQRDGDSLMGISIRSTTPRAISWTENFYTAMVPAKGTLTINDSVKFNYCFAEKKDAAVHIGWTYAVGAMERDMLGQIMFYRAQGRRDFLIFGHSQGGALSYLCFAHFHYLQKQGKLPKDIRFKMYSSAGPKAGNIHFAYDFESYTPLTWAFNVINPEDWIPLMPFTVQTTEDMTATQPFKFIKKGLKTQKLIPRIAMSTAYKGVDRKTKKARKALKKNLGKRVGTQVRKSRPQFIEPDFHHSHNYCRAGNTIILTPTEKYYKFYPQSSDDIFIHHMMEPYLMLAEEWKETHGGE
jgi:hypothetical protein